MVCISRLNFGAIALIHYLYHSVIFNSMVEIILSIVVITIALSAMSIGLLVNKPLKGSCGNCECEDRCEYEVVK